MSRSDQNAGLTSEARDFLRKYEIKPKICSECGHPEPLVLEKIGTYSGMFNTEHNLYHHHLINGRHAVEFLQASPWSSGPMFFIGLRVSDGTEFTWTEDEIEREL